VAFALARGPGAYSGERNDPPGKPVAFALARGSGVAANVTIHGASPWHLHAREVRTDPG